MAKAISKKETTQTAVNFLINYMCANFHLTDESLQKFDQALAMEKEQLEEAYLNGCFRVTPYGYYNDSAEQYYKETYGS